MELLILLVLIWCAFGISAAIVGINRGGGGCGWFGMGVLLGPIGLALAFTEGKRCPRCGIRINNSNLICPHCGVRQSQQPKGKGIIYTEAEQASMLESAGGFSNPAVGSATTKQSIKTCPFCKSTVPAEATACKFCGKDLSRLTALASLMQSVGCLMILFFGGAAVLILLLFSKGC